MSVTPVSDGRTARSRRTRVAVVDAVLRLLRSGKLRPTAREIASEAGVSVRSVYVHFDDLDDLFVAAAERQYELLRPLLVTVPATGPLRERARALARARGTIFETVGEVRRAAHVHAPFSPALAARLSVAREWSHAELRRVFAAELAGLGEPARTRRLAALHVLTGPDAWAELRATPLDEEAAADATAYAIVALLEARP
ncbi:MAG: hypothetical protein KatS3mg009_2710 [Acidimicrobiia bacterium]|nr:MAG: hypothetical protein KatS3mg009_2710 [Acidimicrobiia bacterium]